MAQRNLTAALQAEFRKKNLTLVGFCSIEFVSATEYLWSGYGPISWNGHTWKGVGTLAGVSPITETADIAANGITLSLSGIPTDMINYCLSEIRPDKKVKVWLGGMDTSGNVIVDPYLAFAGYCDVPTITDGGDTCTISLTVEPRWLDRRPRVWRYTAQDQEQLHSGDTGFRFLLNIDKPITWGKATVGGTRTLQDKGDPRTRDGY